MNYKTVYGRIYSDCKDIRKFYIDYAFCEEIPEEKSFSFVLENAIQSMMDEECISELIQNSLEQYAPVPQGVFNIYEIGSHMFEVAREFIKETLRGASFYVDEIDSTGNIISTEKISILEYLMKELEDREMSEQSTCDVGGFVEHALKLYVEKSTWNAGFIIDNMIYLDVSLWPEPFVEDDTVVWKRNDEAYTPVMWFGIQGEMPLKQWTINSSENNIQFWFADEVDEQLEYLLSEPDDAFIYWNVYECAYQFPAIANILELCPVRIDRADSDEVLIKKLNDYMLGIYTKE